MPTKSPIWSSCCDKQNRQCIPKNNNATCSRKNVELETLVQKNTLNLNNVSTENRLVSDRKLGIEKPIDLEARIQKKVLELVGKEEILVDLYRKAAEDAKKKEREFKEKTAMLMQQIERDKDLIKRLKRC